MTLMAENARASIYLDHAAATPLEPEVAAAMEEVREAAFANPSSPHAAGRRAKRRLEEARERILAVCGGDLGPGARLVFTSGATEANRLAILGRAAGPRGLIGSSARDHSSLRAAAAELAARGWEGVTVPLRTDGRLDLAAGPALAGSGVELLCVTLACGQSGSWEDVDRVAAWAAGGSERIVHVDATQALVADGPGPFGLPPGTAGTLALAPHKFGGPRGIGALLVRRDATLVAAAPGPQESGLRGGTEAVTLAVGFARAVELAVADRGIVAGRLTRVRDRFEARVMTATRALGLAPRIVAEHVARAPHVSTVVFPGFDRQAVVMAADIEGVCCATGTACASGSSEPAAALVAMGLSTDDVNGAVRFSFGRHTTDADVDAAVDRIVRVCGRMAPRTGG